MHAEVPPEQQWTRFWLTARERASAVTAALLVQGRQPRPQAQRTALTTPSPRSASTSRAAGPTPAALPSSPPWAAASSSRCRLSPPWLAMISGHALAKSSASLLTTHTTSPTGQACRAGSAKHSLCPPPQDQYLELTSPVPAGDVLFGAGEHISATGRASPAGYPAACRRCA